MSGRESFVRDGMHFAFDDELWVWVFFPDAPFTVDGITYDADEATNERNLMIELVDDCDERCCLCDGCECGRDAFRFRPRPLAEAELDGWVATNRLPSPKNEFEERTP